MENRPPQYNGNNRDNGYGMHNRGNNPWYYNEVFASSPVTGKSRGVAALLAILLGSLGIHYFYLGKQTAGIVFLVCTIVSCGILGAITEILALISGIKMFCISNEQFDSDYVLTLSSFPI